MTATLDTIDQDLVALEAILSEVGGDISEEEAEAAIDAWFAEIGDARDAKLNAYARRIRTLKTHAAAKKEEEARLAAQRKRDESMLAWMKRRALLFVQDHGMPIKGKETREIETDLFRFVETTNGGKRSITYLVPATELPDEYRTDVITIAVTKGHKAVADAIATALAPLEDVDLLILRDAKPIEERVRPALEVAEEFRAARELEAQQAADMGLSPEEIEELYPVRSEEDVFHYARLEPRGVRLEIR